MNNKITMIIGCPGAGKSTWTSKQNFDIIINDDELHKYYPDLNEQQMVRKIDNIVLAKLYEANMLRKPINIAIDAYSLTCIELVPLAIKYNAKVVFINTPLETCLAQNRKRDRHVSEDLIYNSYYKLQHKKETYIDKLKDNFIEIAA